MPQSLAPTRPSERGQILILTVLSMTVLLGITALSIDASFMYDTRNRLFAAADAAAKTVAAELRRNSALLPADAQNFAADVVTRHGLIPGGCGTTTSGVAGICLDFPPVDGPFMGTAGYVEARVSQVTPTFFGAVLGFLSMTPGGRAVAGVSSSPNCLVALNGLSIGNAQIIQPNCGAAIGGNLCGTCGGAGHTEIDARTISAGAWDGGGTMMPAPVVNSPSPTDPLANLVPPAIGGGCVPASGATLTPGCYTTVNASGMVLSPGLYIITGSLSMSNNSSLSGAGVTLYFGPLATVNFGQHDTVTLSAPTSGAYPGIAWFFDRGNASPIAVNNNTTVDITGAFYAKASDVDLGNHLGSAGDCSLIVVGSLTMRNGNGALSNTCAGYGGSPLQTITMAE